LGPRKKPEGRTASLLHPLHVVRAAAPVSGIPWLQPTSTVAKLAFELPIRNILSEEVSHAVPMSNWQGKAGEPDSSF
jgi:hypothetical protein